MPVGLRDCCRANTNLRIIFGAFELLLASHLLIAAPSRHDPCGEVTSALGHRVGRYMGVWACAAESSQSAPATSIKALPWSLAIVAAAAVLYVNVVVLQTNERVS